MNAAWNRKILKALQLGLPLLLLFLLILLFIYQSDVKRHKQLHNLNRFLAQTEVQDSNSLYHGVKIGLALGGGGAKGFAHIGVVKVLEENHIPIDVVVGTSAGAVVGVLYAYGFDWYHIQKILKNVGVALFDFSLSSNGFIQGGKLRELINSSVNYLPIQDFSRAFAAVATDLGSGEVQLLAKGDAGQAVQASSSIPAIFQPTEIGGHLYVDGGLSAPVPVSQTRQMGADVVIAVDISDRIQAPGSFYQPTSWFSTIDQTVTILLNKQLMQELKKADVVIQPNIQSVPFFNFLSIDPAVKEGEEAARRALPNIKEAVRKYKQEHGIK